MGLQIAGGGGAYETVTVNLTPDQIKSCFTSPIEVIAAPAADKVIEISTSTAKLIFATMAYNGADIGLYETNSGGTKRVEYGAVFDKFITQGADTYRQGNTFAGSVVTLAPGVPLVLTAGADPTDGDSPVEITLAYRIV